VRHQGPEQVPGIRARMLPRSIESAPHRKFDLPQPMIAEYAGPRVRATSCVRHLPVGSYRTASHLCIQEDRVVFLRLPGRGRSPCARAPPRSWPASCP
jgi:hypothetical protein